MADARHEGNRLALAEIRSFRERGQLNQLQALIQKPQASVAEPEAPKSGVLERLQQLRAQVKPAG